MVFYVRLHMTCVASNVFAQHPTTLDCLQGVCHHACLMPLRPRMTLRTEIPNVCLEDSSHLHAACTNLFQYVQLPLRFEPMVDRTVLHIYHADVS